jgi:TonB family protein
VSALLAQGADVNESTERGQTALMLAAVFGHDDVVALLLSHGADVKLKDGLGLTAMEWAERRGFPKITKLIATAAAHKVSSPAKVSSEPKRTVDEPQLVPTEAADSYLTQRTGPTPSTDYSESSPPMLGAAANAMLRSREARTELEDEPEAPIESEILIESRPVETSGASVQPQEEFRDFNPPPSLVSEPTVPVEVQKDEEIDQQPVGYGLADAITSARTSVTISEAAQSPIQPLVESSTEVEPYKPSEPAILDSNTSTATDDTTLPSSPPPRWQDTTAEHSRYVDQSSASSSSPVSRETDVSRSSFIHDVVPSLSVPATHNTSAPAPRFIEDEITKPKIERVPSFDASPSSGPSRSMLWLIVLLVFGVTAFATYSIINYFSKEQPVSNRPSSANTEPLAEAPGDGNQPVIGGGLAGAEINIPQPEYPARAAAKNNGEGVSGTVTVRVQVNRKGRVVSIRVVDGDPALLQAAMSAARKATFAPEKFSGDSRIVTGTITYKFTPPKSESARTSPAPSPTVSESPLESPSAETAQTDLPQSGGPLAGTETNLPAAEYPASAKRSGLGGQISVLVRVNRAGKVISWRTGEGDSRLRAAALKAAKKSTFSPAKLPGTGEVVGTITYTFRP